jgi:hypothetical protein
MIDSHSEAMGSAFLATGVCAPAHRPRVVSAS